ncbi:MAG: hypothetical protein Q8K00_08370 [Syntrophales bacterium]|nr:hypothetical protein [Syntrophales bacterium]
MGKATRGGTFQKISDGLNETMRLSSKIYAVNRIFLMQDTDDLTITYEAADGIHIILDEVARQIGDSLSDAIELVNELQKTEVAP